MGRRSQSQIRLSASWRARVRWRRGQECPVGHSAQRCAPGCAELDHLVQVGGAAAQLDVLERGLSTFGIGMDVVKLEAATGRAPAAGALVGAAATVAHPDRAPEPGRQGARVRVCAPARSRTGGGGELPPRQILEQEIDTRSRLHPSPGWLVKTIQPPDGTGHKGCIVGWSRNLSGAPEGTLPYPLSAPSAQSAASTPRM